MNLRKFALYGRFPSSTCDYFILDSAAWQLQVRLSLLVTMRCIFHPPSRYGVMEGPPRGIIRVLSIPRPARSSVVTLWFITRRTIFLSRGGWVRLQLIYRRVQGKPRSNWDVLRPSNTILPPIPNVPVKVYYTPERSSRPLTGFMRAVPLNLLFRPISSYYWKE